PTSALYTLYLHDALPISMPGLVVRSGNGVVVVDADGDGSERTGWNILYLHVAGKDRVAKGVWVEQDDRIGHPSCEGGVATGTHLDRKSTRLNSSHVSISY